ncbi:MAG: hypothetical protein GWN99_15525, partial [Gemmatimonadetes bacterium]|nr:hypothetical protein [Gemmatimonadota bacterium]NIT67441.1 hypothetical protein [Gemmatimonadota bacterium]NIU51576.1 hypothetical protein [Gemmatimonadota bacterium]NIV24907.1 hypothetical protein [Gemmatimonadota bacterium]NIW35272.1 hypothetical protein [Gemmatimonadota bacterium]
ALPAGDFRLTLRWEAVISLVGILLAVCALFLVTIDMPAGTRVFLAAILLAGVGLAYWVLRTAVHADELRLVQ